MLDHYELIQQLTAENLPAIGQQRRLWLNDFASGLGWRPSDQLILPGTEEFSSGHLVVEHGLRNSAVITFLRRPVRYPDLEIRECKSLLNASYNNLIDWHIAVDYDGVSFIYNRIDPPKFYSYRYALGRSDTARLSSEAFDALSSDHPSPNVPALDTALIRTISLWKRQLSAEVPGIKNEQLSALFNSIILVRALEDHSTKSTQAGFVSLRSRAHANAAPLSTLLTESARSFSTNELPQYLFDSVKLRRFDSLEQSIARELIDDFYQNRYQPYFDYDFSIMSKHALSRIYEHYVSLLRFEDTGQQSFFPVLPEETIERSFGNVYTPEFIARFFAKYVRKEMPPTRFQRLRVGDPACGSGIFLRTMLETKFQTFLESLTTEAIAQSFSQVFGVDIDPNAVAAARLSLALLSLVSTGSVPDSLEIVTADTLQLFIERPSLANSLDVVVANPPFVNLEDLPADRRELLLATLGDQAKGKTDLYLGLLQISLAMLKQEGFGLFVLPKNFLISDNAAPLRASLSKETTLHCVVDLSEVPVFGDVGSYIILLIFQKDRIPNPNRPVLVVRCNDLIGSALEDALTEKIVRTPAYEVYWSIQPEIEGAPWQFSTPERASLDKKLRTLSKLSEIVTIRQGIITGADDVFVVPASQVPKREKAAYVPFLPDREIQPYKVPSDIKQFVIYPFQGNEPLGATAFKKLYPVTWQYLMANKKKLRSRKSMKADSNSWWKPNRPRKPENLFKPKIVSPHLVISPKFGLDLTGKFAVSHAPFITIKEPGNLEELFFLLGVLNSTPCFWLISQSAHRYSRGYSRLEVATLGQVPVPNPSSTDRGLVAEIIRLVMLRREATGAEAINLEHLLDERVADAYGLTLLERRLVGMGARA
jgi:type I restriction-modification system DNA methylase subunit